MISHTESHFYIVTDDFPATWFFIFAHDWTHFTKRIIRQFRVTQLLYVFMATISYQPETNLCRNDQWWPPFQPSHGQSTAIKSWSSNYLVLITSYNKIIYIDGQCNVSSLWKVQCYSESYTDNFFSCFHKTIWLKCYHVRGWITLFYCGIIRHQRFENIPK